MLRSLRSRVLAGMAMLLLFVFLLSAIAAGTIRSLDQLLSSQLATLLEVGNVGTGLVSAVSAQLRVAETYMLQPADSLRFAFFDQGDNAYRYITRYRDLSTLTTGDRNTLNRIGERQAELEVSFSRAFASIRVMRRAASGCVCSRLHSAIASWA